MATVEGCKKGQTCPLAETCERAQVGEDSRYSAGFVWHETALGPGCHWHVPRNPPQYKIDEQDRMWASYDNCKTWINISDKVPSAFCDLPGDEFSSNHLMGGIAAFAAVVFAAFLFAGVVALVNYDMGEKPAAIGLANKPEVME